MQYFLIEWNPATFAYSNHSPRANRTPLHGPREYVISPVCGHRFGADGTFSYTYVGHATVASSTWDDQRTLKFSFYDTKKIYRLILDYFIKATPSHPLPNIEIRNK